MDPAVIAIVGSLAAALVTWLVAQRRFSGKIDSSEATDLWQEAKDLRKWSQERIDAQDAKIARLEERIDGLFRENRSLTDQIVVLKKTTLDQERTITGLMSQLAQANTQIDELRRNVNGT